MTSTSGAKKNEVLTELKKQLKTVAGFADSTFKGYIARVTDQQCILIHLAEDDIMAETTDENIHEIKVNILIKKVIDLSDDQEQAAEDFIELVGTVEDKLKDIMWDTPYWEHLRPDKVNYTFKAGETIIEQKCLILVTVRKEW
jgi:hypothetical protein